MDCLTSDSFMNAVLDALKPVIDRLSAELDITNAKIRDQEEEISRLKETVTLQEKRLSQMQESIDQLNTDSEDDDSKALRVTGLPIDCQDARTMFINVAKEKMDIDLCSDQISVKVPSQSETSHGDVTQQQVALVHFRPKTLRKKLYANRTKLKGTNIFISECLTREQQKLFYECRKLKKLGKIANTWTRDQEIFIKTNDLLQERIISETVLHSFLPPE